MKTHHKIEDYTFAVRLKSFVSNVNVNDMMSEEEKDYLVRHAERMIKEQYKNGWESDYLRYVCKKNELK